jgi:hypothetical protein
VTETGLPFAETVRRHRPPAWAPLALAAALALPAAGAAVLWYTEYFRWDFNEEGRAYDPVAHVVHLEQAGVVYGGCFVALALPAAALAAVGLRRRHRRISSS